MKTLIITYINWRDNKLSEIPFYNTVIINHYKQFCVTLIFMSPYNKYLYLSSH